MNELLSFIQAFNKRKLVMPCIVGYFFVAFVEIIAEVKQDAQLITMTKPLLMPLLMTIYICNSKKYNFLFIASLITAWAGNIFFISHSTQMISYGMFCFLLFTILIILMTFKVTRFPGYPPMIIGSLPFMFLYLFVANLIYAQSGNHFFLFMFQGLLMLFFGGFCLGSYILKSSKSHTYLLAGTILFTGAQMIVVLKLYYVHYGVFQPLAMVAFIAGQYLIYLFLLMEERKKRRYKSIKSGKQKNFNV